MERQAAINLRRPFGGVAHGMMLADMRQAGGGDGAPQVVIAQQSFDGVGKAVGGLLLTEQRGLFVFQVVTRSSGKRDNRHAGAHRLQRFDAKRRILSGFDKQIGPTEGLG